MFPRSPRARQDYGFRTYDILEVAILRRNAILPLVPGFPFNYLNLCRKYYKLFSSNY